MGSSQSVECMWLPAQSGKTRKCIEKIKHRNYFEEAELLEMVEMHDPSKIAFHIIISSNNKSLVDQTSTRMMDELYSEQESDSDDDSDGAKVSDAKIVDEVFSWHSGQKENKGVAEVYADIIDDDVKMIICCSNKKRLEYLYALIKRLQNRKFEKKIHVWIDEADVSIKLWSNPKINILGFPNVERITLISATYDSIIKRYRTIKVIPYAETYMSETYHKLEDSIILKEDYLTNDPVQYLGEVLENYSEICTPGTRLFAPGNVNVVSHDAIAEYLHNKGFVICILNGQQKSIIIPDRGKIDLREFIDFDKPISPGETLEIGKTIASIYWSNSLHKYPFAITGNLCLGRGITFQSEHFMFNWGVLPFSHNKAESYQLAARTNGNIKQFKNYSPPTLIMNSLMAEQILNHEKIAINIARLVYERLKKDPLYDCTVTEEDVKDIKNPERAHMHIPYRFNMTDAEYAEFKAIPKRTKDRKREIFIRNCIKKHDPTLWEKLETYECIQTTEPGTDGSYKKHITNIHIKIDAGEKTFLDIKDKSINSCQFYIDSKQKLFIVLMYSGDITEQLHAERDVNVAVLDTKKCTTCNEQAEKHTSKFCIFCGNKF